MFLKASGNRVLSEIASRSPLDLLKRFILLQMSQINKEVPQTEFSLKPFLSQAQLLFVLFGTSERYQNKCTEVGHNRDNQQRNNGKYRGKESKLGNGNIVDILEKKFMVQSGSKPAVFLVFI